MRRMFAAALVVALLSLATPAQAGIWSPTLPSWWPAWVVRAWSFLQGTDDLGNPQAQPAQAVTP